MFKGTDAIDIFMWISWNFSEHLTEPGYRFGNYHFSEPANTLRNSHRRCFVRKGVLRNFTKFTGKHLCQSPFLNKVARFCWDFYLLFPRSNLAKITVWKNEVKVLLKFQTKIPTFDSRGFLAFSGGVEIEHLREMG